MSDTMHDLTMDSEDAAIKTLRERIGAADTKQLAGLIRLALETNMWSVPPPRELFFN